MRRPRNSPGPIAPAALEPLAVFAPDLAVGSTVVDQVGGEPLSAVVARGTDL
jgi:hypothetical protein